MGRNGVGKLTVDHVEYWAAYEALPAQIRTMVQQAELNINPVAVLELVRKGTSPAYLAAKLHDVATTLCLRDYGPEHPRSQHSRRAY